MLRIAILIGIVGLYPISYLAYKDLGKSRREKIERDIYLLGLGREIERKALDELYKNIYSPIQYTAYIGLIVLASLLMILVYFQRDLLEIIAPPGSPHAGLLWVSGCLRLFDSGLDTALQHLRPSTPSLQFHFDAHGHCRADCTGRSICNPGKWWSSGGGYSPIRYYLDGVQ